MGFKDIFISLILISAVAMALLTFAINFGIENGAKDNIINDSTIRDSVKDINDTLVSTSNDANSSSQTFKKGSENQVVGQEAIQVESITDVKDTLITSPYGAFKITLNLIFVKIFGDSAFSVMFGLVTAIVLGLIIIYGWKLIRLGDPD